MKRLVVLVAGLVIAACDTTTTTEAVTASTNPRPAAVVWNGFTTRQIDLDGNDIVVAVAANPRERGKGLSGLTDLTGIDGMLFEFGGLTTSRFWMKDTFIDLDIAFFDSSGRLVESMTMPVCVQNPCPKFGPAEPYRWAVEAPTGGVLADLAVGAMLRP